jgi:murein DD-endopeptidase MepM/ murein hydrolase activator NlpD
MPLSSGSASIGGVGMVDLSTLYLIFPRPERVSDNRTNLVEIQRTSLRPSDLLEGGTITNTFEQHLMRRPQQSARPGVDIDTNRQYTEGPPYLEKPVVSSPVAGTVVFRGGNWGTVRIRDKEGYEHVFLHMSLDPTATSKAPPDFKTVQLGQSISKGDTIGLLSNVKADRDHVHYFIQDTRGEILNPENLWFARDGSVLGIKDQKQHEYDLWLQNEKHYYNYKYDNITTPPDDAV